MRKLLVAYSAAIAVTLIGCGSTEEGVVITKPHVPAGTPSSTGGVHAEAFYLRCKGTKTGKLKDIKVDAAEYNSTPIGASCNVNRGK